jgi:hypothetical protein
MIRTALLSILAGTPAVPAASILAAWWLTAGLTAGALAYVGAWLVAVPVGWLAFRCGSLAAEVLATRPARLQADARAAFYRRVSA